MSWRLLWVYCLEKYDIMSDNQLCLRYDDQWQYTYCLNKLTSVCNRSNIIFHRRRYCPEIQLQVLTTGSPLSQWCWMAMATRHYQGSIDPLKTWWLHIYMQHPTEVHINNIHSKSSAGVEYQTLHKASDIEKCLQFLCSTTNFVIWLIGSFHKNARKYNIACHIYRIIKDVKHN